MQKEVVLALGVGFAFIFGALLGRWTSDEGKAVRRLFGAPLRKLSYVLAILYAFILDFSFKMGWLESASLIIFGLIMAQTSIAATKKMDKKSIASGVIFVLTFLALSYFK